MTPTPTAIGSHKRIAESNKRPGPRKPYTSPRLTCYGSFKDLVQGSFGSKSDGAPGTTKPCWIAEALYGDDDPRTLILRHFLADVYDQSRFGWPLVAMYARFGRPIAGAVRRSPALARALRPIFDQLLQPACAEALRLIRPRADVGRGRTR